MSANYIKKFESFQIVKRLFDKANENVVQYDDVYRVGGIEVKQSIINSYIKKVKEETGKNLRSLYSDSDIAELLVKYVSNSKLEPENIPASALLGGDKEMDTDVDGDQVENTEVTTTGLEEEPNEQTPTETTEQTPTEETPTEQMEEQEPTEKTEDSFQEPAKEQQEEPTPDFDEKDEEEEESDENHEVADEDKEKTDEKQEESDEDDELPI